MVDLVGVYGVIGFCYQVVVLLRLLDSRVGMGGWFGVVVAF